MTLQRSSRDPDSVRAQLTAWLATVLPDGADPEVVLHSGVDANGMSSETLVLDVVAADGGERTTKEYVARVAPAAEDFPVFEHYDLAGQRRLIRTVGELTDVPVPAVGELEAIGSVLGTPFFLMERVDGVVPPDVLPYNFGDNWLFDASPDDQRRLQDGSVDVLARLHAMATADLDWLDPVGQGHDGTTALARNLARTRSWYEYAARDIGRSPLVERALAWLGANLPDTDEAVLCWGDARIGNIMYRDFAPVAVLDWEMATLGPRQLDVSWMVFAHRVFETITGLMEMPGMAHFLREEDVVAAYEARTGVTLGPLEWFHVYNGLQWCIVFMRTGARQIHFGEIERPAAVEDLFHCRPLVESILDEVGA